VTSNWIDRVISYFAPMRGLERAQARAVMETISLHYEGAKRGRRTDGWLTWSTSGDSEVGIAHRLMRDRARDLVRNNPHAKKGLQLLVSNKIGTGIMCSPAEKRDGTRRGNVRKNERARERWKRWVDRCDITGKHDFYGIQALAERTRAESGEALIQFLPQPRTVDPMDVPLRLQVLEPDMIDSDRNEVIDDAGRHRIRYGIETMDGVPIAYWVHGAHPGDDDVVMPYRRGTIASLRIPASELLHFFKPLRPGQTRGITDFASVMIRLRGIDDYNDAEVMRKKVAACLAAFVTTPSGLPAGSLAPTLTQPTGERIEQFRPGMVVYPRPGESVTVSDPKPSEGYEEFNRVEIRAIAAGLDLPYELLSGDLSEVNYTSHRGGLVQFRGFVEADQWQVIVPQLCAPITTRWTREALGVDGMIDPNMQWVYTPPRFGLLDPAKEIPATVAALKAGLDSYQNVIYRDGYDWREKLEEIEEFQKEVKSRGIALESIYETKTQVAEAGKPEPAEQEPEPTPARETRDVAAA
jgi:lambda family phage portal protein